ncbi:MAG: hypothetical protein H6830_09000 [Planctomycetes bacterium]|nr:hypothetical protein [Planctomycetota bacterium]MCB9909859.1 hypothetical protein [Planctomycetota bacterium]HRV80664.1 MnmC family methyltransferase [Planctomycetota bacterium]
MHPPCRIDEPNGLQWVATQDGSWTCRVGADGELFHNPAGAWSEAWQHYAVPATEGTDGDHGPQPRVLWDVCFGLGYGSWALLQRLQASRPKPLAVQVVAMETDLRLVVCWIPLVERLVASGHLEPGTRLVAQGESSPGAPLRFALEGARGRWANLVVKPQDFRREVQASMDPVDWILHDPFSPQRVPQLWTAEIFGHYHRRLIERNGRLLTYSTASAVLGGLREAGFHLYRTPALGLKRGGTLATTHSFQTPMPAGWSTLPESDEAALASRSGVPYRDPSLMGDAHAVLAQRNAAQRTSVLPKRTSPKTHRGSTEPHP